MTVHGLSCSIGEMGTLNLGSTQISSSGTTIVSSNNLNLSGDWVNAVIWNYNYTCLWDNGQLIDSTTSDSVGSHRTYNKSTCKKIT